MKNRVLLSVGLLMGVFSVALRAAAEPMFDIINKTGKTIYVTINNGKAAEGAVVFFQEVKPALILPLFGKTITSNHFSSDKVDTRKPVGLSIVVGGTRGEAMQKSASDAYQYMFEGNGKKIYVTLHKDGALNPQTGPNGGKTDKIEAGYLKEGMITQDDIQKIG